MLTLEFQYVSFSSPPSVEILYDTQFVFLYRYVKELEKGISIPTMMYTYTPRGSVLNHYFIWRVPNDFSTAAALSINQQVVCKLMDELPVYHTRAMKRDFMSYYGLLMSGTKPFVLRSIYREITKDASVSRTCEEEEVDERLKEALDSEDMDIIVDLRELNEDRAAKYEVFWAKCSEYI